MTNLLSHLRIVMLVFAFNLALSMGAVYAHEPRYALVIGNSNYDELVDLRNPGNDAADVAAALKGLGFETDLLLDANLIQMEDAVIMLGNRLSVFPSSIGFFYYAGHGVQSEGRNYLIPVDARIKAENFLKIKALDAQSVLDILQRASNSLNVVVLDACRDNPFGWARTGSRGLVVVGNQPPGSIVVYATSAGSTALDGDMGERNGKFTAELLKNLASPGLEIKEVFNRTGAGVLAATKGKQVPAVYNQFFGSVYLAGGQGQELPPPATITTTTPPTTTTTTLQPPTVFGSLLISTESAGTLYLNGIRKADLRKGGAQRLPNLEVGYYDLEMRYPSGEKETKNIRVLAERELEVAFTWTPLPPSMIELVRVAGGSFLMGSPSSEAGSDTDERPQHRVTVSSFMIGKYEVTVGEFRAFVKATGYSTEAETGDGAYVWTGSEWKKRADANWNNPGFEQTDRHPVNCVSWNDAVAYCNWLSSKQGLQKVYTINGTDVRADLSKNGYRLPTEAEWEYAARGGSQSRGYQYSGSNDGGQVGWYPGNSGSTTHAVGTKVPNELGLYDMSGNVWEWCGDWYGSYSGSQQAYPMGASSGNSRVIRGGSWYSSGTELCSANRNFSVQGYRSSILGFRVLRRP